MIDPDRWARITGTAARMPLTGPSTLMWKARSQSSVARLWILPFGDSTPALLISTSRRPKRSTVREKGEATQNAKLMDGAVNELTQIAGQKPVITKATKSIAQFKLREGQAIGCMVTLRGDRMYEFFDRLVNVALPRVRDFRGISTKSFDGRGNYTLGIKDQLIFPEIDYAKVEKTKGMNISITTTARTDAEGVALLRQMGMPFRQ